MTASPQDRSQGCLHCSRAWVKTELHFESWPCIVTTLNSLFDQASALIPLCQCSSRHRSVLRWHVWKCVWDKGMNNSMHAHVSPPFKRRRPGSLAWLPCCCLLLFPIIDWWDLGFFFVWTNRGLLNKSHSQTSYPLVVQDMTALQWKGFSCSSVKEKISHLRREKVGVWRRRMCDSGSQQKFDISVQC